jgi:ribulose-phosphate 3-epimerase
MKLSVSIIASDLSNMGSMVKTFDKNLIDYLHVDVMDGHFVPNLTIGPGYIKNLKENTAIPLDVHLMIEKPENSVEQYMEIKPWAITIHYESTRFPVRILNLIRSEGIVAGLTINPSTPVESIYDILEYTDMVLIMSIDPGFYGQSFLQPSFDRIRKLSDFRKNNGLNDLLIEVDGGINKDNVEKVRNAGTDIIVAGSAAFKGGDIHKNARELKASSGGTI